VLVNYNNHLSYKLTTKFRDGLSNLISNKIPEVRLSLNNSSELWDPATASQERIT